MKKDEIKQEAVRTDEITKDAPRADEIETKVEKKNIIGRILKKRILLPVILLLALIAVGIFLLWQPKSTLSEETSGLTVTFLDVGKADCIIIASESFHMMIDTGTVEAEEKIRDFCQSHGITQFHYLLLTHLDQDHIGGAPYVLENYEVGQVIQPEYEKDSEEYEAYRTALQAMGKEPVYLKQQGDIRLGNGGIITLYPPEQESYEESNDYSIVTAVSYGDISFLLMGDAQTERMQEIIDLCPGVFTVVKIPHHGDYRKKLETLLTLTQPEYCVISTSKDVLEEKLTDCLDHYDVSSYYTFNGTVIFMTDGANLSIVQ